MSNELAVQSAPMFGLSTLDEATNFASQMSKANLLPQHLKGSPADCLRVVMQAARWQMDPFSVADKTSVISGKLMYEGQLVSAVVNSRGGLAKRLSYTFEGEGDKRVLTVAGTLKGEDEPRTITLDVALAKRINKNGQMNINPDQQMSYIGARIWARRHTPELMLGVYVPDEIDPDEDPKNVTPDAEGQQTPPPERPKVTRSKRGAAAALETEAAAASAEPIIETTATTVVEKKPETAAPSPQQQSAPSAASAPAVAQVTTLKDAEIRVFTGCALVSVQADNFGNAQKPRLAVKAELDGPFKGFVFHEGAAFWKDPQDPAKGCEPDAAWKVGSVVTVTLRGRAYPKFKTDGVTPAPRAGQIAIFVDKVEAVAAAQEPESDIP